MKKVYGIFFGAVLVIFGIIYALNVLDIVHINASFDGWWTVFIILPGLYGLLTSKDKAGSAILTAVGVLLLLAARDIIRYEIIWKLAVPVIIVVIGTKMIYKSVKNEN